MFFIPLRVVLYDQGTHTSPVDYDGMFSKGSSSWPISTYWSLCSFPVLQARQILRFWNQKYWNTCVAFLLFLFPTAPRAFRTSVRSSYFWMFMCETWHDQIHKASHTLSSCGQRDTFNANVSSKVKLGNLAALSRLWWEEFGRCVISCGAEVSRKTGQRGKLKIFRY